MCVSVNAEARHSTHDSARKPQRLPVNAAARHSTHDSTHDSTRNPASARWRAQRLRRPHRRNRRANKRTDAPIDVAADAVVDGGSMEVCGTARRHSGARWCPRYGQQRPLVRRFFYIRESSRRPRCQTLTHHLPIGNPIGNTILENTLSISDLGFGFFHLSLQKIQGSMALITIIVCACLCLEMNQAGNVPAPAATVAQMAQVRWCAWWRGAQKSDPPGRRPVAGGCAVGPAQPPPPNP